ncbi:ATP-binding protein [Cognatishimia sp. SS12]|nr:ATP-binding protein [Cognatishimia sp. SS12]
MACALTLGVWLFYEKESLENEDALARVRLQQELDHLVRELEAGIAHGADVATSIASLTSLEPDMSAERFADIAEKFLNDHSHEAGEQEFLAVAIAPDLVVRHVFPLKGNEAVVGLNYRDLPAQYEAARRAAEAEDVIVAGPVNLIQGGRGLIARKSVHIEDPVTGAEDVWGIVSLVINLDFLLEHAGVYDANFQIAIRGKDSLGAVGDVVIGEPRIFAGDPITSQVKLPYGSWWAAAVPNGGWQTTPGFLLKLRLTFFGVAIALSLLVAGAIRLIQQRARAIAILENAINSIDDGFALYDADDRLITCNDKYKELYTLSADLMVPGARFADIIRVGIERGQYAEAIGREQEFLSQRLQDHQRANRSIEQQLDDGRWLKISEARTPDGGIVGFRVDITELKNAREEAERANQAKSDFLDVMSHELRTPLTVVLGGTPFLCKPELLPASKKLFGTLEARGEEVEDIKVEVDALLLSLKTLAGKVERSAKHLLTLINDVLDFSKIDAGRMDMDFSAIDAADLIEDLVEDFAQKAEGKSLELTFDAAPDLIRADTVRLRQVLINIVGNAIKFTDEGGIHIYTEEEGAFLRINVKDTGCGIPQHLLASVFDKFTQADSSSARRAGGTGLGMAISKKIVELHGGEISVSSVEGEGSVFSFTIPMATEALAQEGGAAVKAAS